MLVGDDIDGEQSVRHKKRRHPTSNIEVYAVAVVDNIISTGVGSKETLEKLCVLLVKYAAGTAEATTHDHFAE